MKKEENLANFDLSELSLSDLVTLYEKVMTFSEFLGAQKIEEEKNGEEANE